MSKIDSPDFVEGDTLSKEQITDLKTDINKNLVGQLDGVNLREEGLDRRVFDHGTVVPNFDSVNQRIYADARTRPFYSREWRKLNYNTTHAEPGTLKGNTVSNFAEMHVHWDPETDSDAIIRLSLLFDTRFTDFRPRHKDYFWDFGLMFVPPDVVEPAFPVTGNSLFAVSGQEPAVSPYQRLQLNNAFSDFHKFGYYKKLFTEEFSGFGPEYDGTSNHRKLIDSDHPNIFGYHELTYPRGAYYQYTYERAANMNSSFSMVAHATSKASDIGQATNKYYWTKKGVYKIFVMYRSAVSDIADVSPPSGDQTGPSFGDVPNMNLSCQIIRR